MKKRRLVVAVLLIAGLSLILPLSPLQPVRAGFWQWTRLTGATDSIPALHVVSSSLMYVAVKGTDNGIYWCSVNPDPNNPSQGQWRRLTGVTSSGPSIDMASFTLYVAVRGMDNGIYITMVDTLSGVQSAWVRMKGSTIDSPTIIGYSPTVALVGVRGADNGVYGSWSANPSTGAGSFQKLPGKASSGPRAKSANGEVWVSQGNGQWNLLDAHLADHLRG